MNKAAPLEFSLGASRGEASFAFASAAGPFNVGEARTPLTAARRMAKEQAFQERTINAGASDARDSLRIRAARPEWADRSARRKEDPH